MRVYVEDNINIDRVVRAKAAKLVDAFREGAIANFEFEDEWPQGGKRDLALDAIESALWNFYSDATSHRLEGRYALSEGADALFRRCALFLRTSSPYEWDETNFAPPGNLIGLLNAATGEFEREQNPLLRDLHKRRWAEADIWPFRRRADLDRAIAEQQGLDVEL